MNTVDVQLLSALNPCKGVGTAANPGLVTRVKGRTFNLSLGSLKAAAFKVTNGYDSFARTLASGTSEILDLRNFINIANEFTQALAKVRLFYVFHSPTSLASSVSVGNSGANGFRPFGLFDVTPFPLPPNGLIILGIPNLAGLTADATHKDLKVNNDDLSNPATYHVGWWGE